MNTPQKLKTKATYYIALLSLLIFSGCGKGEKSGIDGEDGIQVEQGISRVDGLYKQFQFIYS